MVDGSPLPSYIKWNATDFKIEAAPSKVARLVAMIFTIEVQSSGGSLRFLSGSRTQTLHISIDYSIWGPDKEEMKGIAIITEHAGESPSHYSYCSDTDSFYPELNYCDLLHGFGFACPVTASSSFDVCVTKSDDQTAGSIGLKFTEHGATFNDGSSVPWISCNDTACIDVGSTYTVDTVVSWSVLDCGTHGDPILAVLPIEMNCTDYNVARTPFASLPLVTDIVEGSMAKGLEIDDGLAEVLDDLWYCPYKFYSLSRVRVWSSNVPDVGKRISGFEVVYEVPAHFTGYPPI